MKVVLDTNVLISSIYFGGPPVKIVEAWGSRRFQLLVSIEILQVYLYVAERLADRYPGIEYESIRGLIIQNAKLVEPSDLPEPVSKDPSLVFIGRMAQITTGQNRESYQRNNHLITRSYPSFEYLHHTGSQVIFH